MKLISLVVIALTVTTAEPPAPAAAPVLAPAPPGAAPGAAPPEVAPPALAPAAAPGAGAVPNPNAIPAQTSVARAGAPLKQPGAQFPGAKPPAAAPVAKATKLTGVESCKFCCVNAQKGTWTPAPNKKSGCADRPGSGANYQGCCDRLGDCCPVSIGLPANLYMCCDSSKKEVCTGTIYQPQCKIDFTVPDSPAPGAAPAAAQGAVPAAPPGGAPAPARAPGWSTTCNDKDNTVTRQGLPGTCFRRCDVRGRGCPTYSANRYNPGYYGGFGGYSGFGGFLRQFGWGGYGLSYGLGQSRLPSFNPYLSQARASTATTTVAGCASQDACSCDKACEGRGDCCFDYCSFCV